MEGFGTGSELWDTRIVAIKQMVVDVGRDRALVIHLGDGDQVVVDRGCSCSRIC